MTKPENPNLRGILLMIAAMCGFAIEDMFIKWAAADLPTGQILLMLGVLGTPVFALMARAEGASLFSRDFFHPAILWRNFGEMAGTFGFITALALTPLTTATAIFQASPLVVTMGAALFLGEKLGPRRIAGVIAAMIGALIVIRPGAGVFSPAALLPIACAISYAGNALLTRHVGQKEGPATAMLHAALFGAIVTSVALPLVWVPVALADLPLFLLLGCLGTGAQLCIIRSFSITEAGVVAPFAYLGIVFATFWGAVLYGQWPDCWTVIGALVIVGAGLYVWHRETRASRAP